MDEREMQETETAAAPAAAAASPKPEAAPAQAAPERSGRGPRDRREAIFAHFMTEQMGTPGGDKVLPAAGIFFGACAAFVVIAAIWASIF